MRSGSEAEEGDGGMMIGKLRALTGKLGGQVMIIFIWFLSRNGSVGDDGERG